jgi:UDP-N-acetyl-D-mannosaminuronate dehydrogenase
MPGLVGRTLLASGPILLINYFKKNNLKTEVTLAGRKINDKMLNYVTKGIKLFFE